MIPSMVSEAPENPAQRVLKVLALAEGAGNPEPRTGAVTLPFFATWTLDGPPSSRWVPSADGVIVPFRPTLARPPAGGETEGWQEAA